MNRLKDLHFLAAILLAVSLISLPVAASAQARSGQSVRDTDNVEYRVKSGDTLIGLAKKYLNSAEDWRTLQAANRIANPRRLPVGRLISIPADLLRSAPAPLQVVNFTGPVRIVTRGATRAPAVGQPVPEGSAIRTGSAGYISLSSANGSTVSLPSQTSVTLMRSRRYLINDGLDVLFSLNAGRGVFAPTPLAPADNFRVRTPVAVTAVRGTTFRIFHDERAAKSGAEVVEGAVQLAGEEEGQAVAAGFGSVATQAGVLPPERLLPSPEIDDPGKIQTDEQTAFVIKPVSGAVGYRTAVARDAGFLDIVDQQFSEAPQVSFSNLANGTYFVRSRAVAESGLEGLSDAYSFRRQRLGVAATAEPSVLANGFKFAWQQQGEGTPLYDFVLYKEGEAARPMVAELGMVEREIVVSDIPPGVYFWQVTVVVAEAEGLLEVAGPPQKLTISP